MTETSQEDLYVYDVVINLEGQYSIWRRPRQIPNGWTATGFHGAKKDCLAHIDEVWTDMRPLSLRQHMDS